MEGMFEKYLRGWVSSSARDRYELGMVGKHCGLERLELQLGCCFLRLSQNRALQLMKIGDPAGREVVLAKCGPDRPGFAPFRLTHDFRKRSVLERELLGASQARAPAPPRSCDSTPSTY